MVRPCSREIKTAVVAEYLRRVQIVWSSSLSAAEKVRVHNTWVAAVLRYYVASVEWGVRKLSLVDVRTRAVLVRYGAHVPTDWTKFRRKERCRNTSGDI